MGSELNPNLRWRLSEPLQIAVTNIHASMKKSPGSMVSLAVFHSIEAETDENLWSWRHLKTQFREKDSEVLFQKYNDRINNSVFVVFLLWCFANNAFVIGSSTLFELKPSLTTLYVPAFGLACSFCLLILSCNEAAFNYFHFLPTTARYLMCFILVLQEYVAFIIDCFQSDSCSLDAQPRLGSCFSLTLLIYFMPPLRSKTECVIMGFIIFLLECFVSLNTLKVPISKFAPEFGSYIMLNMLGMIKLLLDEITKRRSFLDKRSWVETTLNVKFQKDQEEKLMLSIIPKYISVSLKLVIRKAIENMRETTPMRGDGLTYASFHDLYVQRQNNVSILFADIVNFTPLTETMEVANLVEMLNELFGKFDDAAEKNSCLRIKIIGDCYYCVCGVPEPLANHAYNCVIFGFEMIDIICDIRRERSLNIDMRIGINSGDIFCGLIGMKKWQYDIWSRDVTIANLMEQSGESGRVHVSKATRDQLGEDFRFEIGNGALRNSTVKEWKIETFFVVHPNAVDESASSSIRPQKQQRRVSFAPINKLIDYRKRSSNMPLHTRRKTLLDQSLLNYRKMISRVNLHMEETINKMALSKKEQWLRPTEINPLLLTFKNWRIESMYLRQRDPLFKYNLPGAALIFAAIIIICAIEFVSLWNSNVLIVSGGVIFVFYVCVIYIAWHNFIFKECYKGDVLDQVPSYELKGIKKFLNILCDSIHRKVWIRLIIWLTFAFISLTWISIAAWYATRDLENTMSTSLTVTANSSEISPEEEAEPLIQPRFLTYSFALLMVAFSSFTRINFYLKLIINILTLLSFILLTKFNFGNQCLQWSSYFIRDRNTCNSSHEEHLIFSGLIFLLLHFASRQTEYLSRLSFLWKENLKAEQDETAVIDLVNKTLLLNILPFHVAERYFTNTMPTDELYHEKYKEVAVMFASISNFMDFYTENELNLHGKSCLKILNEIILEFDELLAETQFSRIEKMKIIGSTYMAAAGLRPGIRGPRSEEEETVRIDAGTNLAMLVNFAISMMEKLSIMNDEALQEFQLRIGIDCGPVIAGVVGAAKPLYDIWGNTVNVASRMDSTGKMGRIQVTEKSAQILMEKGFECESRGQIHVKGKGALTTYFVKTPFDSEEITRF